MVVHSPIGAAACFQLVPSAWPVSVLLSAANREETAVGADVPAAVHQRRWCQGAFADLVDGQQQPSAAPKGLRDGFHWTNRYLAERCRTTGK